MNLAVSRNLLARRTAAASSIVSSPSAATVAAKTHLQRRTMNTMQASNRLKTAFAQGKQSMGMWQMIPGANVSRILARSGCDWVLVDCEHGNIDGEFEMDSH